jgi:hypothetical protein
MLWLNPRRKNIPRIVVAVEPNHQIVFKIQIECDLMLQSVAIEPQLLAISLDRQNPLLTESGHQFTPPRNCNR